MTLNEIFLAPFVEFEFMRRALVGTTALALSACPVGVFLMLRRMSLSGDAIAHSILPGAAIGFLVSGLQLLPMTFGGLVAGLAVAVLSGIVARSTIQREDASLAAFYLVSLALGVLLVSLRGSSVDLLHVLFGSVLALNDQALVLIAAIATVSLVALASVWRALVAECLDPVFLRSVSRVGPFVHLLFLVLVVLNLVGGFQALGTLLSVGLMILPAAAARFWTRRLEAMCALAIAFGLAASVAGLLVSYHLSLASGPSIILAAGLVYLVSLLFGTRGLLAGRRSVRHRIA
ncbi:zinc ABC transporter permease AztB [Propylenella binzhouense]|uniref:Metal ABC transporter permease n=1 Tax=Propylenella binzhouense TaxID=2555902 RepID=A0A964T4F9_9HYPH|nr:zinc ABC transporter permease AztB [Propylenella binzhouense]MYZ48268.1 metal ABC transporter permease [Propylenella binzhouense]